MQGKATRGRAQKRGDVLQVEQPNNARAALHQQVVALAGRGAVEVEIARTELAEEVLGNDGTQFRRLLALVEVLLHLSQPPRRVALALQLVAPAVHEFLRKYLQLVRIEIKFLRK